MPDAEPPDARTPHDGSFAARLKAAHGAGVDPQVSLDAPPASDPSSPSAALVRRLSEHALKSPRYQLEGELARGGMGAILKIWDEDLRRHLAMKIILGRGDPARSGDTPRVEPNQLARFLEEAQVTGQLDHPGIVPVHELGLDHDGRVYFTMKLVKGRDLKHIFELVFSGQEQWNETRALSVILRVCEALAYAHAKGVIHRDLKPANIMVGDFGEVYVMDWGLARVLGRKDRHDIRIAPEFTSQLTSVKTERREEREELSDSPLVTMDGDVVGTPAYMPLEQARGEIDKLSARSDVYAIGAMLYHLLARHAPYLPRGARLSNRTVLGLVVQGPPAALTTLRKDLPAELVAIVEKAMSREAALRYADTLGLAEDLRAYLEHRVVGAYETGAWAETKKWVERNKPLAASLAAAVLLLLAGLSTTLVFKARADEKEKVATQRASELQIANTTIEQRSDALETANAKVQATVTELQGTNARLEQAKNLAQANAARADEQASLATRKANDVLSLSAIQELKELEDRADALWPAHPENLSAYDEWLSQARVLIDGRAAEPARGIVAHPSLKDHEAKLAELRLRAQPLTSEQVDEDRATSPSFAEWASSRARLVWLRRMLGEEAWPDEPEIEAQLARETLPSDANGLNALAWPLVDTDPTKIVHGSEIKGLLLARRAVSAATPSERAGIRDTLAWALFRTARFDEALAEERLALSEVGEPQRKEYEGYLASMERAVAEWDAPDARSKRSEQAVSLAARVAELDLDVNTRRTYEFDDAQDRWWHEQLSRLVADLRAFTDEKSGGLFSSGTSQTHGWGIEQRAEFARSIEERSVSGAEARRLWDEAISAISTSDKYAGLVMTPQLGLLPIGMDPQSRLWEFAHLQTGAAPQRGADGKLVLNESMGLVFVLIPSGDFWMGAQKTGEHDHNYDPQANNNESPVRSVALDAYFLSKYEMTQAQWLRFVGRNPSNYGPQRYSNGWNRAGRGWTGLHPVEQVTWTQCMEVMSRLGLALPSEGQWENGARAGTRTPWWTGSELATLAGTANLSDAYAKSHGANWSGYEENLDDGNAVHAEVGSYCANAFGLHDVTGNVWEWCRDGYGGYELPVRSGDGERQVTGASVRVNRGGCFVGAASFARSAYRNLGTPEYQLDHLGLRPARASSLPASQPHLSRK